MLYKLSIFFLYDSDSKFLEHINEKRTNCEYHQGMFRVLEYFSNLSGTHDLGKNINDHMLTK